VTFSTSIPSNVSANRGSISSHTSGAQRDTATKRLDIREIMGTKIMREVTLK
jgi:hypothetical protein